MNTEYVDIWSLAHASWGIVLFHFLYSIWGKRELWFVLVAVGFAVGWEVFENSEWAKARFRKYGFPHYQGDTKRNMLTDQGFTLLGFAMAWYGPQWFVLLPMLVEVLMYLVIRDNTLLAFVRWFK